MLIIILAPFLEKSSVFANFFKNYEFKTTIVAILCNEQNSKITSQKAFDIAKETLINSQEDEKVIIK